MSCIARRLGRSCSTISRELKRNRYPTDGRYRAYHAARMARGRRSRARSGSRFGAVKDHEDLHAEWRYPADLVADLVAQLGIFDANTGAATGGGRQGATKTRNTVLDDAGTSLAQVRFYYCSASRDTDQTPELAAIGFQPRRDVGAVVQAKAAAVVPAGGS